MANLGSRLIEYLEKQRDLYGSFMIKLCDSQQSYNKEIAERVACPTHWQKFYNRDYYGTVHHNGRAVYVKYLGFFDGNPANLYQLHTEQAALFRLRGADAVVLSEGSFAAGDYRWVAKY